jgi:hypothetical protein
MTHRVYNKIKKLAREEAQAMDNLIPIYCQEHCPLNKHCCFGEVYADSIGDKPIRERHKCEFHKRTGKEYVETETASPAA